MQTFSFLSVLVGKDSSNRIAAMHHSSWSASYEIVNCVVKFMSHISMILSSFRFPFWFGLWSVDWRGRECLESTFHLAFMRCILHFILSLIINWHFHTKFLSLLIVEGDCLLAESCWRLIVRTQMFRSLCWIFQSTKSFGNMKNEFNSTLELFIS